MNLTSPPDVTVEDQASNDEGDTLIKIADAMRIANISRRTLYNWMDGRLVSYFRAGRVVRFNRRQFLNELGAFRRSAIR